MQEIPVLLGDIQDAQSLRAITAQTQVLLTTAGPYARLGTPVVEACIQERTHYCDLTGTGHKERQGLRLRANIRRTEKMTNGH